MSSPLHDLLERAASAPVQEVDVDRLVGVARSRRRRRRGFAAGLATVAVLAVVFGVLAISDGGRAPTVSVAPASEGAPGLVPDGWQRIDRPDVGLSLAIPPGWTDLGPIVGADPALQALVVGTGPHFETSATCSALPESGSPFGTWLMIYDAPTDVDTPGRPSDFLQATSPEIDSCPGDTEHVGLRIQVFSFVDGGRALVARIATKGDPDGSGFDVGREILNTLRVSPVDDGATEQPGSTTTEPRSEDSGVEVPAGSQSDDERAVRDTVVGWLDGRRAEATSPDYVEDYTELAGLLTEGRGQHSPDDLAAFRGRVDELTLLDETHASVRYTVYKGDSGAVVYGNLPGSVVKIDGQWKVSRETVCALLAKGGLTCPPRDAPAP